MKTRPASIASICGELVAWDCPGAQDCKDSWAAEHCQMARVRRWAKEQEEYDKRLAAYDAALDRGEWPVDF